MRIEHITMINITHEGLSGFSDPYAKLTLGRTFFHPSNSKNLQAGICKNNAVRIIFE